MSRREEAYQKIQDINDKITNLQVDRNTLELETISVLGFPDWPAFRADYLAWQRGGVDKC